MKSDHEETHSEWERLRDEARNAVRNWDRPSAQAVLAELLALAPQWSPASEDALGLLEQLIRDAAFDELEFRSVLGAAYSDLHEAVRKDSPLAAAEALEAGADPRAPNMTYDPLSFGWKVSHRWTNTGVYGLIWAAAGLEGWRVPAGFYSDVLSRAFDLDVGHDHSGWSADSRPLGLCRVAVESAIDLIVSGRRRLLRFVTGTQLFAFDLPSGLDTSRALVAPPAGSVYGNELVRRGHSVLIGETTGLYFWPPGAYFLFRHHRPPSGYWHIEWLDVASVGTKKGWLGKRTVVIGCLDGRVQTFACSQTALPEVVAAVEAAVAHRLTLKAG